MAASTDPKSSTAPRRAAVVCSAALARAAGSAVSSRPVSHPVPVAAPPVTTAVPDQPLRSSSASSRAMASLSGSSDPTTSAPGRAAPGGTGSTEVGTPATYGFSCGMWVSMVSVGSIQAAFASPLTKSRTTIPITRPSNGPSRASTPAPEKPGSIHCRPATSGSSVPHSPSRPPTPASSASTGIPNGSTRGNP